MRLTGLGQVTITIEPTRHDLQLHPVNPLHHSFITVYGTRRTHGSGCVTIVGVSPIVREKLKVEHGT